MKHYKLKLWLTSLAVLSGCANNNNQNFNKEDFEKKLRLQCPCTMFSPDQKEIFNSLKDLDYFVVVPASGVGTQDTIRLEKATTFGLKISDSCLVNNHILGAADTDENRFKKFNNAMHTNHKILWSLRGGYGSYRIINSLKKLPKPKHKKIFVGFSDTTAMSVFIAQNWKNWEVIHAPVFSHLVNFHFHKDSFELLSKILHGSVKEYSIENLKPLNTAAQKNKLVQGQITGGNLTMLETSLSTSWDIQTKNKIIFIEDVGENSDRIYRSLYHLKLAGKFNKVKAIVFGTFSNGYGDIKNAIKQFANELKIPVYITDQFGHDKINMPIVYNAQSSIHDGKWTIKLPKNWNRYW